MQVKKMQQSDIYLGYIGVHYIFQLALAAQESNRLGRLYCSIINRPGFWGSWISRYFPSSAANPLDSEKINPASICEKPYALLKRSLGKRLPIANSSIQATNALFDRVLEKQIQKHQHRIFVGVETCCKSAFAAVKQLGGFNILDCPGVPTRILSEHVAAACKELGIAATDKASDRKELEVKDRELELADLIFVCSEFQKQYLVNRGFAERKVQVNPLWANPLFFNAPRVSRDPADRLRVIFAGYGSVAKGLPYVLLAKEMLRNEPIDWSIVGGVEERVIDWAGSKLSDVRLVPRQNPQQLASTFAQHDLLVFPSLGDSFGFIVMEAMATGMPVIASNFTGAPVPDDQWRVPIMSATAIADRIRFYLDQRNLLAEHGLQAKEFARQFNPESFRKRANAYFDLIPCL